MKRALVCLVLSGLIQAVYAQQFLGTYTTKPEIVPGVVEPYSEKTKQVIEMMTWELVVTDEAITITFPDDDNGLVMKYRVSGDYLLAINKETDTEHYVPFYNEGGDKLHGFGTVFFRVK